MAAARPVRPARTAKTAKIAKTAGTGIVNILQVLREKDLEPSADLYRLFALASEIQNVRIRASKNLVSRTSMLYAALIRDRELLGLLERSGFDFQKFKQRIDPEGQVAAPAWLDHGELTRGIPVQEEKVARALERYQERFPGRPIDSRGLIYGFLCEPGGGPLEGRLAQAELNLSAAVDLLAASMAPPLDINVTVDPSAGSLVSDLDDSAAWHDLTPFDAVWPSSCSNRAVAVLNRSRELAFEYRAPLTSSLLLVALCEEGRKEFAAAPLVVYQLMASRDQGHYEEVRRAFLEWYRQPDVGKSDGDQVTPYFRELLQLAQDIARQTSGDQALHARHLVGAVVALAPPPGGVTPGAWLLLRRLGYEPTELAKALLEFLTANLADDDLTAWRRILLPEKAPAAAGAIAPLPPFDTDDLRDRDLLGIGDSVKAFASLFASQDLVPPLSVGLFGDWGSGKSFFMRQLRQRVDRLSKAARTRRQAGEPAVLLGDIVQVEFNAWHYAEVNLWASLVTHIFDTLNRHFSPVEELKDRWEALIRRLDEANRLQADSQGMLRQAEEDLAATQERLQNSRLGLGDAVESLWKSLDQDRKRDLAAIASDLGLDAAEELKDELVHRNAEARQLGERIAVFQHAAVRGLGSLAFFKTYALFVLAIGLASVGLLYAAGAAGAFAAPVRSLVEVAASTIAVFSGIITWLGSALKKGSKVVAALQRVEVAVRDKLQASPEGEAVRAAERAVQLAHDEVEERRRKVSEVRSQLESLRPSRWLSDFLRERASSSDYHKYLGLTAIVRRDFEKLHQLMTQEPLRIPIAAAAIELKEVDGTHELNLATLALHLNQALRGRDLPMEPEKCKLGPDDERAWHVLDPENARRIEVPRQADQVRTCSVSYDGPRIDRIVLYIDDLDRCPPTRVVEVLEAVHLLLALPLFVVVVGVDVRWVSRALELQYRDLWRRSPEGSRSGGRNPDSQAATPRDYLEKIFQVPFWLRPLDAALTGRMLTGLLERPSPEAKDEGPPDSAGSSSSATPATGSTAGVRGTVPLTSAGTAVTAADVTHRDESPRNEVRLQPERGQDSSGGIAAESVSQSGRSGAATATAADDDNLDADTTADKLVLDDREIELIKNLAPLVGRSPRAVKRFVNTYRIIRAAVPTAQLDAFLGTPQVPGVNRIVLMLLGFAVGAPELAVELESAIGASLDDQGIKDFVAAGPKPPSWHRIASELTNLAATPGNAWTVADLRRELPRVNQYSFRSGPS